MSRLARAVSFLILVTAWPAGAQVWDNSGNSKLSGVYYFREVFYIVGDQYGDIARAVALYGSINFSGSGTYSLTATAVDSSAGSGTITKTGTYSISASGYGFLSNPYSTGDLIYGLVSNGVFIGSSTENGSFNDLFIAAASSGASNASFQGSYSLAYMNTAPGSGDPTEAYDALATLNPNGAGTAGTMNVTAYAANNGSTPISRSETNVRYGFSNGIGSLVIPAPANPSSGIPGTQVLYISPDGNLIFGGSPGYWDMFVGVRTGSGTPGGLYYQAGIQEDVSQIASGGGALLTTFYGSLVAVNNGTIIAHQRLFERVLFGSQDYSYSDSFPAGASGGYTDSKTSTQYAVSQDGALRVGLGIAPFLGVEVALRGPALNGSGVFLDPTGVQSSATFAPFTAGLARGELILLNGSGLADQFVQASGAPFPPMLGGVQVLINNVPAALYYVSPTVIAVLVPYGTASGIAQIQVVNKGTSSNAITAFVRTTAPGVFVANGYGIAQHLDYSLVTPGNPAHPGESLLVYVTGLGDVFPAIADGAPGPANPLSNATNTIVAALGGISANISFAGLVPTIAGDYVVVLTVPDGVATGDALLSIAGPDSYTAAALLPVATP
ncbi:MAG: hypothetical protein JWO19_3094 [Bryobacterales bacterium]|nr:hypothetical protein [Bryobacterales bacterium]